MSRLLALAALSGVLLSCASGSTAPALTTDQLSGPYELLSVNGRALPVVTLQHGDTTVTVTRGTLLWNAETFRETANYVWATSTRTAPNDGFEDARFTIVSPVAFTFSRIRHNPNGGGEGTIVGRTLSLRRGDSTFVYVIGSAH